MNTSEIGNIGEARVLCEFVKLHVPCYLPYGDGNTCDLIAEFNGKMNRIQIKTTQSLNRAGAMEWKTTRQDGYHGTRACYEQDTIDYFAFYCIETDIVCLVPFNDSLPKTTVSIRLDDYTGVKLGTMRFAADYQIKSFVHLT